MNKTVYKIIRYSGVFANCELDHGVLTRYDVKNSLSDYFCADVVYVTKDKWGAVKKFAENYHDTEINLNAYDFQEGLDCVYVIYFQLVRMWGDILETIIFESDFPDVVIKDNQITSI